MVSTAKRSAATSTPADRLFQAMADRTRLRLLSLLQRSGPDGCCVCHLVDAVALPQPTVSRHLAYLRRCGLVSARKHGLWSYYSLLEPSDEFHANLLACLTSCRPCVPELQRDTARLKRSMKCCS